MRKRKEDQKLLFLVCHLLTPFDKYGKIKERKNSVGKIERKKMKTEKERKNEERKREREK